MGESPYIPSSIVQQKKGHGVLKWLRKKLVVTVSGIRKNDTGRAQV